MLFNNVYIDGNVDGYKILNLQKKGYNSSKHYYTIIKTYFDLFQN